MTSSVAERAGVDQEFAGPSSDKRLAQLGANLQLLRVSEEKKSKELKELREKIEGVEGSIIAAMEASGFDSIKLNRIGTLIVGTKKFFRLPPLGNPVDRKSALAWLKRVGCKDAVREDINPQTLSGLMRDREEAGKQISPLIAKHEERYLSVRK